MDPNVNTAAAAEILADVVRVHWGGLGSKAAVYVRPTLGRRRCRPRDKDGASSLRPSPFCDIRWACRPLRSKNSWDRQRANGRGPSWGLYKRTRRGRHDRHQRLQPAATPSIPTMLSSQSFTSPGLRRSKMGIARQKTKPQSSGPQAPRLERDAEEISN